MKTRLIASGVVLGVCLVLTALGHDSFVHSVGYMSAGFLFATGAVDESKTR